MTFIEVLSSNNKIKMYKSKLIKQVFTLSSHSTKTSSKKLS